METAAVCPDSTSCKWLVNCRYHDHGFVFAYIRDFEGMDSGRITANIVEGKVNRVNVVYVDDNGNPKKTGGETPVEVVDRELPFQVITQPCTSCIQVSQCCNRMQRRTLMHCVMLHACQCFAYPGAEVKKTGCGRPAMQIQLQTPSSHCALSHLCSMHQCSQSLPIALVSGCHSDDIASCRRASCTTLMTAGRR